MSRLRSSRNLLVTPMVIRMVLDVQKPLQMTNIIIADNFGHKKSFLGVVWIHVLQEPVGAFHGDQDGPGCPETS